MVCCVNIKKEKKKKTLIYTEIPYSQIKYLADF